MKKCIITACLVLSFAAITYASGKKTAFVSSLVNKNFNQEFANAKNVSWSTYDQFMKAEFAQNNLKEVAYYTSDGDLVASMHDISFSDMPASVQKEIIRKYKNYTVKESLEYFDTASDEGVDLYGNEDHNALYFVDLAKKNNEPQKNNKDIILQVSDTGNISFFSSK